MTTDGRQIETNTVNGLTVNRMPADINKRLMGRAKLYVDEHQPQPLPVREKQFLYMDTNKFYFCFQFYKSFVIFAQQGWG